MTSLLPPERLTNLLCCPSCGEHLQWPGAPVEAADGRQPLDCSRCGASFAIVRGIPRMVSTDNYAASFGFQWNRFRLTQLDSHTGRPISHDRFYRESGWRPTDLAGALVLDVGCGAGRFTEIALAAGSSVVAVDYSVAVDACRSNHADAQNLLVLQADIYHLPLAPASFDFVYCFGVLQHTPQVADAFAALVRQVKPGGRLAIDVYPWSPLNVLWPKYWFRPLTRRLAPTRLFGLVETLVPTLLPLSRALGRVPIIGQKLKHLVPVADYADRLPLSEAQLREWAILDTFDMFAPAHDAPQRVSTVHEWFVKADLHEIEVFRSGLVVGRASR
jgi:SAM-dependent methyltransferase